jgi:hypothetical protein
MSGWFASLGQPRDMFTPGSQPPTVVAQHCVIPPLSRRSEGGSWELLPLAASDGKDGSVSLSLERDAPKRNFRVGSSGSRTQFFHLVGNWCLTRNIKLPNGRELSSSTHRGWTNQRPSCGPTRLLIGCGKNRDKGGEG